MARLPGASNRLFNRQPVARDRIWTSIRILREFTQPKLVATADAGEDNVKRYVNGLCKAGYLALVREKRSGHKGGHARYLLIRNTGPRAPRLQRDGNTYDPNEHKTYSGGLSQCQNQTG